jgi:CheY-like chemotaxis protein
VPKRDLDEVLAIHDALMQAVMTTPGARNDAGALAQFSKLCARAVKTVNDLEARVLVRDIENLARLLCYADGHVGMGSGSLQGVDALKLQLFNTLSALRGRLYLLELQYIPSRPELPALEAKKSARILVVEDDPDSALSLKKLLELCGYTVAIAYSAEEGLEAAEKTRPDIVLCDIGLPDTNGYAFAAALRSKPGTARIRLIAVTAYGTEQDKKRSREAGFHLHLVKPVRPERLLEELERPAKAANGK